MTSGTSSSHNRIKDTELAEILIPIPCEGSEVGIQLTNLAGALHEKVQLRYGIDEQIRSAARTIHELLRGEK